MKVAIAFSTKDRVELSKQSIMSLREGPWSLFINDGSKTPEGESFAYQQHVFGKVTHNVRGGADAAIVFGLTQLLNHPENYDVIGLVENDVLLHPDWFGPTRALFERGRADGLDVGAVSARCFKDRILIQRDGYAVQHNSGAGCVLMTREAATHVLRQFRNAYSTDNRRMFMQLCNIDIGGYWAFRGLSQFLTADWNFEVILARHGLASLALVPNMVEMIGQVPPLEDQGLEYASEPVEDRRNDKAFDIFVQRMRAIRNVEAFFGAASPRYQADNGVWTIFPHQIQGMGGSYDGDWRLKWSQGFGPFTWEAAGAASVTIPVSGPCQILVGGGEKGGKVQAIDLVSGYDVSPELPPEGDTVHILQLVMPASVSYRNIKLTALTPGTRFYGLQCSEPQPWDFSYAFDHSKLPPVA